MASGTKIADMTVGLHFDGSKMYVQMNDISKKAEAAASGAGTKAGKGFSAKMGVAMGAIAGIASSIFSKVSSSISASMGSAISRMDTLNNFPKVMQSLGYASDEASKSVGKIADHLDGLPTTLDDMVSNTQQLAASMGNLNQGTVNATSVGLAFNDMMLAGGKGTEAASRAFIQYNQMLAKGRVDMQSWNSLVEAAPGQMNQLSESLLGAGKNQRDLYQALQDGTLSFDQLNAAMVKLDNEGGKGFESFNEQAIAGTAGLATQLENVRTSITKVITAALQGEDMSKPLEQLLKRVNAVSKQIIPAIGRLVSGIMTALPEMLSGITDVVIDFVPELVDGLSKSLPTFVQGLINFFTSAVGKLVPQIPKILLSLINGIIDSIKTLFSPENMKALLKATIDMFKGLVKAIPDIIVAIVEALPDIIVGIIEFLTDPENIGMIIEGAIQLFMGIVMAIPRIIGKIGEAIGKLVVKIGELIGNLWQGLQDAAVAVFNWLPEPIRNFLLWLGDIWKKNFEAIGQFFGWIAENVFPVIGNIVGAIGEAIGVIADIIGNIIGVIANVLGVIFNIIGTILGVIIAIVTNVIGFIVGLIQNIIGVVANVVGFIVDIIQNIVGAVASVIGAIVDAISNAIGWITETFSGVFEFIGGIFKGIGDIVSGVANFIGGVFKSVADFVGGIFQGLGDFIGGLFEAIGNIIKAPINVVINMINGVISFINSLTIPDWVPGIGGWHADIGMIPTLATGGVTTGATTAVIGEAGQEVVLPLEQNTGNWSGLLAHALAEEMKNQDDSEGQTIQVTINNNINNDLDAREIGQVMMQSIRRAAA